MNVHERALVLAASTIDFDIAPAERDELDRHLAGCAGCRADVAGIRADAEVIGGLPMLRREHPHAARLAPPGMPWRTYRLVLVTALVALLAGVAVFAGAQLLQRWNNVVPPPVSIATPTPAIAPSSVAPTEPAPTAQGFTWNVRPLDVATMGEHPTIAGLAYAGGRFVAVGGRRCEPSWIEPTACWGLVWTSTSPGAWTELARAAAPAVSTVMVTSGPDPGLIDIAGGSTGFVAIGYGLENRASIWHSRDGTSWRLAATLPGIARVRAVAATAAGWAVVGQVLEGLGDLATGRPRAAIWTSADGLAWSRVPDGSQFDVGGYFDTMEEPGSGGILDVASDGSTVVGVGNSCDDRGRNCVRATWRSTNGLSWERLPDGPPGRLTGISANDSGFTAIGLTCDTDTDASACDAIVVHTITGDAWSVVRRAAYPVEYVGTVAADGFAVVLLKDQSYTPSLLASVDGVAWHDLDATLAPATFQLTNAAMTVGAGGEVVVIGWGMPDLGATSFGAVVQLAR